MKHGLVSKSTKIRARTLSGSMTDIHLIERMGCPDDEYDPEIRDIVELLSNIKSVDELAVEINKVFIKWFEEDLTIEKCYPVALTIWNKLS
ncbi:DUF1871 family protein [Bacillus sp. JJ1764]|uniref:DUF1871 family protein n=1 Tax=Bacillus sp. JJ1764 TaxID=3122964 RepID=UPI002FFE4D75